MKVLMIHGSDSHRLLYTGLDSAVLRPGEPVFVADDYTDWRTLLVPAVRINRLGTSIKAASAKLYYNEATLFHYAEPAEGEANGIPALAMDRALSPGAWQAVDALGPTWLINGSRTRLNNDYSESYSRELTPAMLDIDSTIEWLSKNITLKQGDIILFGDYALPLGAPVLDTSVAATINSRSVLNIRIK